MTVSAAQLDFYRREGFLHLRGVVAARPPQPYRGASSAAGLTRRSRSGLEEGRIADPRRDLDFQHRLLQAWHEAGRAEVHPQPAPRPGEPGDVPDPGAPGRSWTWAEDLLGTAEVSVHGIFNARPKLPDQVWTPHPVAPGRPVLPRRRGRSRGLAVVPAARPSGEHNSCLQVAPRMHRGPLFDGHHDQETGFLGLSPEDRQGLQGVSIEMEPGDLLCFTQKTPHRALANRSDAVRWSLDVRYEATDRATESGKAKGFVARSPHNPAAVVPCAEWERRWAGVPKGSYY